MAVYKCPVCGYDQMVEPPENHAICPSCGTEFDYDDVGFTYRELREAWLSNGATWFSVGRQPPHGWSPISQLTNAGMQADVLFLVHLTDNTANTPTPVTDTTTPLPEGSVLLQYSMSPA